MSGVGSLPDTMIKTRVKSARFRAKSHSAKSRPISPLPFLINRWKLTGKQP